MMKLKFAAAALAFSTLFSAWLYWGSDVKVEQVLTSREWQSTIATFLSEEAQEKAKSQLGALAKIRVTSNVKYLPNNTYLRVSYVELFNQDRSESTALNISETGEWELSADYLLISPKEFKDTTAPNGKAFTPEQLEIVKQLFIMDAEQSRRIDIINSRAILLTSLNHGSRILSSN